MNRIVYIDGGIADGIGSGGLELIAAILAGINGTAVDVLTHGGSKFHETRRITGRPGNRRPAVLIRRLHEIMEESN